MLKVFSSLWLKKSFINNFFLFLLEVNIESGMLFFVQYTRDILDKILDEEMHTAAPNFERPSDYLRGRCPLCFGGKDWKKPDDLYVEFFGDTIIVISTFFLHKG